MSSSWGTPLDEVKYEVFFSAGQRGLHITSVTKESGEFGRIRKLSVGQRSYQAIRWDT